ncbi:MAG: AcrR family transcriptional regulator [Hyphomicrobiaceae bacterium]|jgi:AcrR family transcriptional regulator
MNRPSIYRAFGDKEAIYRKALAQFCERMDEAVEQTLFAEKDVRKGLTNFYLAALDVYTAGEQQLGCMVMSTAASAATSHPEIQADLMQDIQQIDRK